MAARRPRASRSAARAGRTVTAEVMPGSSQQRRTTAIPATMPISEPFSSAHRAERVAHVLGQELRLLPCREVRADIVPLEEDEVRISRLRPILRRLVDLVAEGADPRRQRKPARIEEAALAVAV